ncbi:SGNH/GDSL hydrolase family protein [Kribbella swartbergensis]
MTRRRGFREVVVAPFVAMTVSLAVLALVGGLLVLLEPSKPDVTAPISSSVPDTGARSVHPGKFGSGTLGPWQNLRKHISSDDEIQDALMFNGVFMFGDSIAVQDGPALEHLLRNRTGDAIAVHDWSGQPTSAAVDALEDWEHRFGLPSRIVMAVGSNDIFDPPGFAAQVERALHIAGPSRTVYWVNVYVGRTRQPAEVRAADQANSAWINQQLEQAAVRHPNLRIIRWAEYLAAQPGGPASYLRDGVHTSEPLGQNARNELIAGALEDSR